MVGLKNEGSLVYVHFETERPSGMGGGKHRWGAIYLLRRRSDERGTWTLDVTEQLLSRHVLPWEISWKRSARARVGINKKRRGGRHHVLCCLQPEPRTLLLRHTFIFARTVEVSVILSATLHYYWPRNYKSALFAPLDSTFTELIQL